MKWEWQTLWRKKTRHWDVSRERERNQGVPAWGTRDQKGGDAVLSEKKQDGHKPTQHSDLVINVFSLLLLLEETQEDRRVSGGTGGKANSIWNIFPWSFAFCQSRKCSKFIENFLYVQRLWLLPSGTWQYSVLAEMFVNYFVCLVLRRKWKTRQLSLPQKFLSGAVSWDVFSPESLNVLFFLRESRLIE